MIILPNVVSVSGTVGVGKTSVLDLLEASAIFSYVPVPPSVYRSGPRVDLPSLSASSPFPLSSLCSLLVVLLLYSTAVCPAAVPVALMYHLLTTSCCLLSSPGPHDTSSPTMLLSPSTSTWSPVRQVFIIREPVDKSVAHPGLCWDSLLAKMYDGKERFSAIFQVKAAEFQASVGEEIIRITDLVVNTGACPPLFIVERDPNSLNLFLQINQRTGRIDADEASVCREVIRRCNTWTPALAIHLTASHDICWARVTSRSRSAEDNINEDYLRELNKAHSIHLSTQRLVSLPICQQAEICTDKYTAEQVTTQVIKVRNGPAPPCHPN